MSESLILGGEFPSPTYEQWVAEVERALKGAPFDKKMFHKTYEGITLKPIYTAEDWPSAGDPSGFPGAMPFTRGGTATGRHGAWDLRQLQTAPDLKAANHDILVDLDRGVTSITIRFDAAARAGLDGDQAGADLAGHDGVMAYSVDDLDQLLDGVYLDLITVGLEAGAQFLPAAGLMVGLLKKRKLADTAAQAAFNADPLGTLAAEGTLPYSIESGLQRLADLAAFTAKTYPKSTAVAVDTRPYHGAGASEAQDLACALATGVAYLKAMSAAGLDIDAACKQIVFVMPVACDFFSAIAKLRAARKLWSRVAEACGASEPQRAMNLQARTADIMMSKRDPWVNMLRTTVASAAAAIGGADSTTIQPFDAALGLPDALSRRVARNTPIVLQEESSLNRVIDPSGGSWYIETLTDQLARQAWQAFQEIEAAGGMVAALGKGLIAERIEATHAQRIKNLATRRDPLTGVSEFPNIREPKVAHATPDYAGLKQRAGERLAELRKRGDGSAALKEVAAKAAGGSGLSAAVVAAATAGASFGAIAGSLGGGSATAKPLPRRRLAEVFEELRDASDAYEAKTGKRPAIFLANMGPIAHHTGRATFAKNFFEVGGIEALTNDGFKDAGAAAEAFKKSGAKIAIICSSDKLYEEMVAPTAPALKGAGAEKVFLAGHPGDKRQTYTEAGVDDFIFLGCNILDFLRATLTQLGVIAR